MKLYLLGIVIFASMTLNAAEVSRTLTDAEGWYGSGKVEKADDESTLSWSEGQVIYSYHKEDIDPSATYKMSGVFSSPNSINSTFYFGMVSLDNSGKTITSHSVNVVPETTTTLLRDAKVGDTELLVEDASNWKVLETGVVAFKVDPSKKMLDLPNFNLSEIGIFDIQKHEKGWLVTLKKPLKKAYLAKTAVREHQAERWALFAASHQKLSPDWKEFSLEVKGIAMQGLPRNQWRRGTRQVRFVITLSSNGSEPVILKFKNIKLEKL
jgi:hypothetical protein